MQWGEPKRLHPETEQCSKLEESKVFVEADLSKELPKTYQFKLKNEEEVEVEFVYPWLPLICQTCSKWGHLADICVINSEKMLLTTKDSEKEKTIQGEANMPVLDVLNSGIINLNVEKKVSPMVESSNKVTVSITNSDQQKMEVLENVTHEDNLCQLE